MDDKAKQHWVFRAHVLDRAGALTSIASAFSNEGISIDTVVGHGTEERTAVHGSVVLTFYCTEEEKDVMVRKVKRLSKVSALQEHPYESQSLRKSAVISTTRELKPRDVAGEESFLTCEMVKKESLWTYFIAGSPSELDQIIARLAKAGVVKDIVYSIVGL